MGYERPLGDVFIYSELGLNVGLEEVVRCPSGLMKPVRRGGAEGVDPRVSRRVTTPARRSTHTHTQVAVISQQRSKLGNSAPKLRVSLILNVEDDFEAHSRSRSVASSDFQTGSHIETHNFLLLRILSKK